MTNTLPAYRSKYGFYACDYETYRQLKQYHLLLLRAYRQHRRWLTWRNKQPQNRRGAEPPRPERCDSRFCGPRSSCRYQLVQRQYRLIRRPSQTPEAVPRLDLPGDWQQDLQQLSSYYLE